MCYRTPSLALLFRENKRCRVAYSFVFFLRKDKGRKIALLPIGEFCLFATLVLVLVVPGCRLLGALDIPRGLLRDRCERRNPGVEFGSAPWRSTLLVAPVEDPPIRSPASGFGLLGRSCPPLSLRILDVSPPFSRRSTTHPFQPPIHSCTDLTTKPRQIDGKDSRKNLDLHWFPHFIVSALPTGTFWFSAENGNRRESCARWSNVQERSSN
jgi:hypothetical protein